MAKKATIDVYYDLLSPYAWAAFEALCYYRTTWNVEVRAKPFLLAAVMGGSGNKPPMTIPRKGAYLCKDLQRLGHYYGVPFNKGMLETSSSTPFANPMESLIPMRFLLSLEQSRPELVENAARELWTQKWCRAQNFDQTEYLQQVTKKLGLDNQESDNVLSNCHNSVIKQQLNKNTEDALKCGAFGAPWIVVHLKGQSYEFFGPYRFHFIADLLGEEIPEKTQKTVPNTRSRVDLFFDVISPYSWIGFEALCRYRAVWNIDLHFRPFLLGALLKETGNKMPSILPAKKAYIYKDIERVRSYWSVPLTFLKDIKESMFVKGSLAAQRYLTSLNRVQPERLEDAARELWMRRWSRDQDIHLPQHLQQVSETIGLSTSVSEKVISDMELPEVKEMLKWTTQEAVDEGAFGAPWSVVHMNGEKHSFFGSDRFHIMARLLGETFPGPMFAREYCTIMGKKTQVDLYFDVISPYAWIGFEALCRYCSVWNIDLHLRPYSLAHIMKATGNQPPALVLARGAYLLEDLMRMREYWSIPINKMKDTNDAMFNKGSLAANRYLISLSIIEPDRVEEAARELWMRRWSRDQDFHLAENLVEVSNTLGLSDELTEKVIAGIDTDETKDKLKANTDEALKEGAFGAPWIVVHHPNGKNYSFFGSDRFPLIAHILGETFPGPMRELAKTKLISRRSNLFGSMAKAAIDLFFDVLSPYSWIGFEALCRYRTVWNIELRLRPFLLGGIMKESGNQPPGILPARGAYMAKDIDRNRDYWQIPLGHLKDPFDALLNKGSMAPERYLISLGMAEPDRVEDAARELWMRRWSRDEDFHLPQHLAEVSKKIGLSTEVTKKVISRIDTTEIKDKLKANTNEALEEGAFGAPWIVVHHPNGKKYSFFGSDRFHIMADILGEKFPGPMRELAKSKL